MANYGKYRIPREFRDEDKWFRFFTKQQLIYVAVAIAIDLVLIMTTLSLHMLGIGVALSVVTLVVTMFLAFFVIPPDKYLVGGGYRITIIILRLFYRRLPQNRVLYVKGYGHIGEK